MYGRVRTHSFELLLLDDTSLGAALPAPQRSSEEAEKESANKDKKQEEDIGVRVCRMRVASSVVFS